MLNHTPSPPVVSIPFDGASFGVSEGERQGLVSCRISDHQPGEAVARRRRALRSVSGASRGCVRVFADVVEVRFGKRVQTGGGRRAVCVGFSAASRRRLIHSLAKVRVGEGVPYFLTLTYPGVWNGDWKRWKRDLKVWRQRLIRDWSHIVSCGVWRVEFQKRGAPHFHLILICKSDLPAGFKHWLSQSWYAVVDSGDVKHLYAGTQVKKLDSRRAIRLYVSKYVAKLAKGDQPGSWGRNWGFFGEVDQDHFQEVELSASEFVQLRRLMRRWLKSRSSHYAGYLRVGEVFSVLALGNESLARSPPTVDRMLSLVKGRGRA